MLHGDAAAERRDAIDRLIGDRLGVVEEPVQPVERHILVHPLEDIERARDRLVVGRVQPPGPAILREDADHRLELALHLGRHVRPRLPEVLEVGGGEDQHLAGAVVPEIVVALLILGRLGPVQEIVLLAFRLLREEVVGQADGELVLVGELANDRVVVGIVLKAAAGVDRAGHAEPVQLAHEVARRIDLVVERQLRPLAPTSRRGSPAFGLASSRPVGSPRASRTISPPGGSGVSLV